MQTWLFESGGCQFQHDFARRERISFAGGGVKAYMEEVPVLTGISLYRLEADGNGSFQLEKPDDGEGRIVLVCLEGGTGTITLKDTADTGWRPDGQFVSLVPEGRDVGYDVHARDRWRLAALRIEAEALDHLARDAGMPQMVRDALTSRAGATAVGAPLAARMRRTMRDLLDPTYAGPMLNLYRQGKSIEMLLHQFDALETVRPSQQLRPAELWRVREARERLLADLANPPELEALARSVGLSAKRLTAGFKSVYGMTVFDYLLEARMTAAREMLEDGAELPLKQLAWRLGYAHPSNFVIAFRRRFGIAPGAYRRSRK